MANAQTEMEGKGGAEAAAEEDGALPQDTLGNKFSFLHL